MQSNQVREYLRHAKDRAQQAASQTDPKLRRDYLIMGAVVTVPDYVAIGVLITLIVWAMADWFPRGKL